VYVDLKGITQEENNRELYVYKASYGFMWIDSMIRLCVFGTQYSQLGYEHVCLESVIRLFLIFISLLGFVNVSFLPKTLS